MDRTKLLQLANEIQLDTKNDRVCRESLQNYYRRPFPRTRLDFLKNLELDGFNPDLMIGFEYNRIQHYHYPNWIHKNQTEFEQQVRRDKFKLDACDASGVYPI